MKTSRASLRGGILAVGVTALALLGAGCGDSDSDGGGGSSELAVVGYSTPETVYTDVLEPAFTDSPAGSGVSFSNSFGASGDQRRAVEAGQDADVVHFSQGGDMIALEEDGKVDANWDKNKYKGIGEESVVVIVTRPGNPEGIKTFQDLLEKDVDIITPNPLSSGSARWNIMAVYGSEIHAGKTPDQALDSVRTLLEKTIVQPGSGRDALTAFTQGEGDVLLSYENEAIKAQEEGEEVDYVIPPSTIRIQTPIAVTSGAPEAAQKFLDFIWSDDGQKLWSDNGYRPVNQQLLDTQKYPVPEDLFSIDEFGGWETVTDEFFDEENGKVAQINEDLGVPSE